MPRRRFLPVKMSSDLLLVMSNLYKLHYGSLSMSDKRVFPVTPLVKLGTHFAKVRSCHTEEMRKTWNHAPTSLAKKKPVKDEIAQP